MSMCCHFYTETLPKNSNFACDPRKFAHPPPKTNLKQAKLKIDFHQFANNITVQNLQKIH